MASSTISVHRIFAPAPATTRGQPTPLSSDAQGQRLAYASGKTIYIRSIDDPSDCSQYNGHKAVTTVARFSPSGFKVASGDSTGIVRIWEPQSIETTRGEYGILSGRINDIAWDGDSKRIIVAGDGKELFGKYITTDTGNSVGEVSGHSQAINSVSIRQQRPLRAATVSDDGSMCFLHGVPFVFKNKEAAAHRGFIFGTAFSPNGSLLVTVGADRRIQLYNGQDGTLLDRIGEGEHTGSILSVSWAADGKRFVTASADQTIKLWDVESRKSVQSWRLGGEATVSIPDQQVGVVFPHGRGDGLVISLSLGGHLNYLQCGSPSPVRVLSGTNKSITALTPTSGRSVKTFYTGSFDGRVCQWDVASGAASIVDGQSHTNQIVQFAAAPNRIHSIGWDDTFRTLDESAGTFLGDAVSLPIQPKGVASSGNHVFVTMEGAITHYENGKLISELALGYLAGPVAAHGPFVAVGGNKNTVMIYKLGSEGKLQEIAAPSNPTGTISALAFSRDGSHLAAGNVLGKIYVYDAAGDWQQVTDRWSAHTARVTSIAWDETGTHAASGSVDTNLFVWHLEKTQQGRRVKAANAHKDGVSGVCWIDKTTIASAGGDAAVKIWKVQNLS